MGRKLPISISDFRKIREGNFLYVDKTKYAYNIISSQGAYFLSRPRRFGKSLTISMLNELYKGSNELFKGLWIENRWDWNKKHPVVRISFATLGFKESGLRDALNYRLDLLISENNLEPSEGNTSEKFAYLLRELSRKNKVVVLIDEYDAPIISYLAVDNALAAENREILKEFYTVLKESDAHLEFVFLTGVSKFSKVGVFSGLNNLKDLSMHPDFTTMLGYTQEELEGNFADELASTAQFLGIGVEELLEKIEYWYNGYRFGPNANRVYNPVSTNLFFDFKEFRNFWFETGTPTFLINLLKKEGLYDFNIEPTGTWAFDSFELEDLKPLGILYQTGYLTIKEFDEDGLYHLDYPNFEVKNSMIVYLLEAFGGLSREKSPSLVLQLSKAFTAGEIAKAMEIIKTVFADLPYQLYEKNPEKFYHAAIHLLFSYVGIRISSEVCTSHGRADALVETDTHIYLLEFKLDSTAEKAFQQILDKNYAQAHLKTGKSIIGIGVNFSSKTKNVEGYFLKEIN